MPDVSTLIIFIASALIFLIIPGPAVLYIVARSIDQGRMAGIVSALGIQVGTMFHVAAAAFGVSALVLSSALAFNTLKYLGALYLIYLGIQKLFTNEEFQQQNIEEPQQLKAQDDLKKIFYQAVIVDSLYAVIAGSVRPWLKDNSRFLRAQQYFTGTIYLGLGVATALTGINKK